MIEQLDEAQQRALRRMREVQSNVFICWWKMGTGKTRIALHAFQQSGFQYAIIITRRIAFGDWVLEHDKCDMAHTIYQNGYGLTNILKWGKYAGSGNILLLSAGDLKNRPVVLPHNCLLIVDELYLFSNPKSKRSLELQRFSTTCQARLGLSGTLMPARDNYSIYGQLKALGSEKCLARTGTEFRELYQDFFQTAFGRQSKNKPGSKEAILKKVSSFVDVHFPESRPTRIQVIQVNATPLQKKAIKALREHYEYNGVEYDYAPAVAHAINGISGGWHINNSLLEFLECPKIARLKMLIDEIMAEGERVVVWCAYHADIARIAEELEKDKRVWLEFSATCKWDQAAYATGKISIVLATEANGSSVNYFGDVKYAIYYSINYKSLDLDQSMGRHERKSSSHDGAHYYFLQTKGTLDARIYKLVKESKVQEEEIIKTLSLAIDNKEEL